MMNPSLSLCQTARKLSYMENAADMAREPRDDQARVARAFHELYHNPQTPTQLHQALGEFVGEAMNDTDHVVMYP